MKRSLKTYFSTLVLIPAIFLAQTPIMAAQPTTIGSLEDKQVIAQKEEIRKTLYKGLIINKTAKAAVCAALIITGGYLLWKKFGPEDNRSQNLTDASISGPYKPGTSVGWTAEEKAGLLTTVADTQKIMAERPTETYGHTFANTAIMVGTSIGITALASIVMSPVIAGINYIISPSKNYEHVAVFMRSQTSIEQTRSLMHQYAQLSIHGRADRAYYLDALASAFNGYNEQVTKLLGYMLFRAGAFKKAGNVEKAEQAVVVEKFILQTTNACIQEVNKIIQANKQDEIVQLPEMLKQYNESVDNEIQRFLLLEDHAEQRELNPGSAAGASQEEMLKLMLQQQM